MRYQNEGLPPNAVFVSATPELTEQTVPPGILLRHKAPKGKVGYLVVTEGALQFVWEDTGETFDADPSHRIVIWPGRFHHVCLAGPVRFRIEFYDAAMTEDPDDEAERPGAEFVPT